MTLGANPWTTYAFGSTIDSCTYCCSEPRFAFCASAATLSRFGPTVPVAFAGLNVWQLPQALVAKTAFPADALPLGRDGWGCAGGGGGVASDLASDFSRPTKTITTIIATKNVTATPTYGQTPRLPGKFGIRRGSTNELTSAKTMNAAPIPAIPAFWVSLSAP